MKDQAAPAAPSAPANAPPGEDRSAAYQGHDASAESVPGGALLIASYAVVWFLVLALVVRVFQRQTAVARRLADLEDDLRRRGADPGA